MKKKILFVIDSLTCGGAEKSLVTLLQLLDYDKIDVDLLLVRKGGIFDRYVPSDVRMSVVNRGVSKIWSGICQISFSCLLRLLPVFGIRRNSAELLWSTMRSAYKPLEKEYDVAIAFQQGFSTYYVTEKVKAAKKIAWINNDLKKEGFREIYNRRFYDRMDAVVAVSDILCGMLGRSSYVNPVKLHTVYDILDSDSIREMAKAQGFDDNLPKNTWRLVTVGRVVPQKNYTLAVEAAKILKEHGLRFRWYFIGDGSEFDRIKKLINVYNLKEEVVMMGMKKNPYPYMSECDIYVQTSSHEGYGLTLCEARILHRPEISTDFPVAHNHIRDGVNGLIAEMTPERVADRILSLVKNPELRKKIIEATYQESYLTKTTEIAKINALLLD